MRWARQKKDDEQGLEVDLSPLIDVTFLLLIFFVLTTSFHQERQLEIERPAAASSQVPKGTPPLRVALVRGGQAYLGGEPVASWLLKQRVGAALRDAGATDVLLIADAHVASGRLVEVIDACRLAGAEHVALSTRDGETR